MDPEKSADHSETSGRSEYSSLRTALDVTPDTSVSDLLARLLDAGVVVDARLILGLAEVDLVYVGLRAILCNADRAIDMVEATEERVKHAVNN